MTVGELVERLGGELITVNPQLQVQGVDSAADARSKVSASGPCPAMQLCKLAPPGTNPSALASYAPNTSPINSFIKLR